MRKGRGTGGILTPVMSDMIGGDGIAERGEARVMTALPPVSDTDITPD
jgi:hypothetical protein